MRPLIAITGSHDYENGRSIFNEGYYHAVEAAGGIPVLIPMLKEQATIAELIRRVDGVLFAGGPDLDPVYFGQEPHPKMGRITPERDALEIALAKEAFALDLPVLGICRGIQLLNVVAGGTIIQDIPSKSGEWIKHSQDAPRWYPTHSVKIAADSRLKDMLSVTEIRTNSFHHQAIDTPAPIFTVTAKAPDGIIEAVESTEHKFVVGVQWHPEEMFEKDPRFLGIFQAFVEACKK